MFRMGGSANEGITSGLDKPKRGLVDEPGGYAGIGETCLLYTSPSPRDGLLSRMPSSA